VTIGSGAFPALANPNTAMQGMTVYGAGMNWYPSRGVALLISYVTRFSAPRALRPRARTRTLVTRLQLVL
jgi:hypothetical protein